MAKGGGGGGRGGGGGGRVPATPGGWEAGHEIDRFGTDLYFKRTAKVGRYTRRSSIVKREGETKYYLSTRSGQIFHDVRKPFSTLSVAAAAGNAWLNP